MSLKRKQQFINSKSPEEKELIKHEMDAENAEALSIIAEFIKHIKLIELQGKPGKDGEKIDYKKIREQIQDMFDMYPKPKDGYTPIKGKDYFDGEPGENGKTPVKGKDYLTDKELEQIKKEVTPIKGKDYDDGEPGRPGKDAKLPNLHALAINTINVLENLEGDERLDASAIKNLKEYIIELGQFYQNQGGPGIVFHDDTMTGSGVPGDPLSAVSGGVSVETPSGVIDSSNVSFTVNHVPKFIVLNGVTYFENDGYTRSGLSITMLVVPMTGSTLRSIY